MAELVGKRYATSLFEVALELKKTDDFHSQLEFIKETLNSEEKILQILNHPRISKKEKRDVMENIFGKHVSKEVLNFLFIIIDRRREANLIDMVVEYNTLFKEYKDILDIDAITAIPMKESSKERLSLVLKDKFGKGINLSNSVDPSIIGGVLLKMNDKIIDSSLKNQLKEMELLIESASL